MRRAAAGTIAVLLPGTPFFLNLPQSAPAALMRELNVPIALATDFNPGSSYTESMQIILTLACLNLHLTPLEALAAATINAAFVVGLGDRVGSLEVGKQADLIRIDLSAPRMQPVYDIYATLVFSAMPADVQDVMVGGRWIMRGRKVESLERKKILRDAGQIAMTFKAEMARIDAAG